MAWSRSDDTTLLHPKVLRGGRGGDDRMVNEVYGFVARCCTWSGGLLTDGFIPQEIAEVASPSRWQLLTKAAVRADMLRRQRGPDGDWGWCVVMEDQLFHIRSRAEVLRDRDKDQRKTRVQQVAWEVRLRDGDQCRYCAKTVEFKGDRRSNRKGTYDHVIPPDQGGTEDASNIVVACGACNRIKGARTPEEADMALLPPPDDPYYTDDTRSWLQLDDQDYAAPARTDVTSDDAASARPAAEGADTAANGRDRRRRARPGSDLDLPTFGGGPGSGSGRVEVRSGSPDPPPQDRPRARGSRGRRGRPPTPPQHDERSA